MEVEAEVESPARRGQGQREKPLDIKRVVKKHVGKLKMKQKG